YDQEAEIGPVSPLFPQEGRRRKAQESRDFFELRGGRKARTRRPVLQAWLGALLGTICSPLGPHKGVGSKTRMAKPAEIQPERRRATRSALRLNAMMRDGNKSRVKARVIDISTHGCRIECTSAVAEDAWIWLNITGLENQYCRVVWHCQEFVGLEFAK